MLCRLGLLLSMDGGNVGDVDGHKVGASLLVTQLGQCLDKGHALDITDGTSKLNDAHIRLHVGSINRDSGNSLDPVLDGVGDVWNAVVISPGFNGLQFAVTNKGIDTHLDSLSEVITTAFLLDDLCSVRR